MADVDFTTIRICTKCAVAKHLKAFSRRGLDSFKSQCKECIRENDARRRAANPRRSVAAVRKWRAKNPEKVRAAVRALRAKYYEWNKKHPEAKRIRNHNRRARLSQNGGKLSKGLAGKLFGLQRGKCACGCGQELGSTYHMDHRMPIALGGSNTDDNMQLLTKRCNLQKKAKHPVEFMQERGFLL